MTLQQLNYAITIAEAGSINKASEILYVSQPSLTESIKELEKELNGEDKQIDKNEKLNNLVDEFLNMEKPNKEIIREFIERIEIHSDKQVDIYFNFKPLQELNDNLEKFICAKKEYERKAV